MTDRKRLVAVLVTVLSIIGLAITHGLTIVSRVLDFLQFAELARAVMERANKVPAPLWYEWILYVGILSGLGVLVWDIWLRDFVTKSSSDEPTYCTASEAMSWIAYGEMLPLDVWEKRYSDFAAVFGSKAVPEWSAPLVQAERMFPEAARAGDFKIKGKKEGSQTPENVPDDVLAAHIVIPMHSNRIQIGDGLGIREVLEWDVPEYQDLIVRRKDVIARWPKPIAEKIQNLRQEDASELHIALKAYRGSLQTPRSDEIEAAYEKFEKIALQFNSHRLLGPYIGKLIETGTPLRAEKYEMAMGSPTALDGDERMKLSNKFREASDVILRETEWAIYD